MYIFESFMYECFNLQILLTGGGGGLLDSKVNNNTIFEYVYILKSPRFGPPNTVASLNCAPFLV